MLTRRLGKVFIPADRDDPAFIEYLDACPKDLSNSLCSASGKTLAHS